VLHHRSTTHISSFFNSLTFSFFNSFKASLEVAYQIRREAKFVTFSEDLMWTSINYLGWGQSILSNIMRDAEQMAHLMAEIYRDSITGNSNVDMMIKNSYTISVAELSKIEEVHLQVKLMAQNLILDMDDIKERDNKEDNLQVKWANEILPFIHDFDDAVCACACDGAAKRVSNSPNSNFAFIGFRRSSRSCKEIEHIGRWVPGAGQRRECRCCSRAGGHLI
jgi:Clostripain family